MVYIICFIFAYIGFLYFRAYYVQKIKKVRVNPANFTTYYGVPGTGKTTFAAYLADSYLRNDIPVYSNVPIKGCYKITKDDIGKYALQDYSLLIWDEAGIEFNSRNFKTNLNTKQIEWFKMHRHELVEIVVFSQGYDDYDKILRNLSNQLFVLKKSLLPYLIYGKRILKKLDIDDNTHQPCDMYFFSKTKNIRILAPLCWKLFNSWSRIGLPPHDFPLWDAEGVSAGQSPAVAEPQLEELTLEELEEMIAKPVGTSFLDTPITAPDENSVASSENL